eukprot:PhF_6_TR35072/c0_g1_i1/m.51110/K07942/ARL1; ADP-ribosylation factor-like protein 1
MQLPRDVLVWIFEFLPFDFSLITQLASVSTLFHSCIQDDCLWWKNFPELTAETFKFRALTLLEKSIDLTPYIPYVSNLAKVRQMWSYLKTFFVKGSSSNQPTTVWVTGVPHVGKKMLVHRLHIGFVPPQPPVFGLQLMTTYNNLHFYLFDSPDSENHTPFIRLTMLHRKMRKQLPPKCIIYVAKKSHHRNVAHECELLKNALEGVPRQCPILIFLNKVWSDAEDDLKRIMDRPMRETARRFDNVNIFECSADTGDGLYEGLDWLSTMMKP